MELPHIVIDYPCISAAATSARRRASITGVKMTRKGAYSFATAMCPKTIKSRWGEKLVWIWTENKQVMMAAVERGWNTFIFPSAQRDLAAEWSALAFISPLFIEDQDGEVLDAQDQRVGVYKDVSSPPQLENLQSLKEDHLIIVHLRDWQVIPAENIVAAFHNKNTVLAISNTPSEAQIFLQALELGLGGVVLKVEDVNAVLEMKDYFDKRVQSSSKLELTKVTVTNIQTCGMGDRVCVDLCSIMSHGEGLLVGSFARGLFLVHSECLESNYISSRPFRVNAVRCIPAYLCPLCKHLIEQFEGAYLLNLQGPVHAYVATPGGKTKYLSELNTGMEVTVVDNKGMQRTAIVGRVKIETRPLVLVEAKPPDSENEIYSILLQNAETVALVSPTSGEENRDFLAIPVTSLKIGDEILLRVQGGARHTGIEIKEFILEK